MQIKTKSGRKVHLPSAAEDRRIKAGIVADPDTHELTDEEFAQMVPFSEMMRRRGRPVSAVRKVAINVRLDPEVVGFFRGLGRGWQTRLNAALRDFVRKESRRSARGT